jgi:hypothetical protein
MQLDQARPDLSEAKDTSAGLGHPSYRVRRPSRKGNASTSDPDLRRKLLACEHDGGEIRSQLRSDR